jgi:hypothetical protein
VVIRAFLRIVESFILIEVWSWYLSHDTEKTGYSRKEEGKGDDVAVLV